MRNVLLLIVGAAGIVLLAGCGNSRLSHGDFVKRANEICKTYDAAAKKLPRPGSVTEIETYARSALVGYRDALAKLEALKPPKEDAVTVGQWLGVDRKIAKDVEAIASAARARRIPAVQAATAQAALDNANSDRLAGELGLTACVKP